jgi:hypothetical protein
MLAARQLSFFKSKQQRGTAPPAPTEFSIHVAIADLLRRWALPGIEWSHFPAGELRSQATAGRLHRMGTRRGWADFQIFDSKGAVMFLEIKRPGGRLSEDQRRIADHMKQAGHKFEVVDSVESAIGVLVVWGVVRRMTVQ